MLLAATLVWGLAWTSAPCSAALLARATASGLPKAALPAFRAYLGAPSSSDALSPLLERLSPLAGAPAPAPLPAILTLALSAKAAALAAPAANPASSAAQLRRGRAELGRLERALAPWVSNEDLAPVAAARRRCDAALERRLLDAAREDAAALTEAAEPDEGDPRDAGAEYERAWAEAGAPLGRERLELLKGYRVVFAPGLFGDVYRRHGLEYFDAAIADLRAVGVDAVRAPLDTQQRFRANASALSAMLSVTDKPVLLLSHSKGGVETLHSLLASPAARANVAAWAAVQAPFLGSPIADWVMERMATRRLAAALLLFLGGDPRSVHDVAARRRLPYMRERAQMVARLVEETPVLSIATWTRPRRWRWDTLWKPLRDLMHRLGLPNDGLVPTHSAVLPGGDFVLLEGIEHRATVMPSRFTSFDRVRFTRAVVSMLLERAERPD